MTDRNRLRSLQREWNSMGLTGWISLLLTLILAPGPAMGAVLAQQAAGDPLRIVVLEGEGSINNVRELTMRSPVVRVVDAAGKPVAGAAVSFSTPAMGASAIFVDGGNQASVTTDDKGVARIQGMRPNNVVGNFEIRVTASANGNKATARISQTNAAPAVKSSGGSNKGVLIGVLLAVAGGVGAAVALSGGGSSGSPGNPGTPPVTPPATPVTITAGAPGFSAP
ncbi:MAG: carboxypeptidase regulatory-like domain-containing protein [Bryobacterales bacterium]|nr:carboxypeptidase regulatory-like domain-containing protein [Bryobacterales bacterium]